MGRQNGTMPRMDVSSTLRPRILTQGLNGNVSAHRLPPGGTDLMGPFGDRQTASVGVAIANCRLPIYAYQSSF